MQNIDLHALTEWIPERVAIRPGSSEFDANKEFERLIDRFHKGHCLVTVATGELSEAEADRAGLVPTHAYAMLDVREIKVRLALALFCSAAILSYDPAVLTGAESLATILVIMEGKRKQEKNSTTD